MLFSPAMARAIREGRKTQTRRIVKWPFKHLSPDWNDVVVDRGGTPIWGPGPYLKVKALELMIGGSIDETRQRVFPRWGVGDQLWVKETFKDFPDGDVFFAADFLRPDGSVAVPVHADDYEKDWRWKPSMFMPHRYSRTRLEVAALWAERLMDISETDALAEGVTWPVGQPYAPPVDTAGMSSLRAAAERYFELWDKINGAGAAAKNPWVWALKLKEL